MGSTPPMSDSPPVYVVIASGAWVSTIRGIFDDETAARRYAKNDEALSDGYHTREVWAVPLNAQAVGDDQGEDHFDPPGQLVASYGTKFSKRWAGTDNG